MQRLELCKRFRSLTAPVAFLLVATAACNSGCSSSDPMELTEERDYAAIDEPLFGPLVRIRTRQASMCMSVKNPYDNAKILQSDCVNPRYKGDPSWYITSISWVLLKTGNNVKFKSKSTDYYQHVSNLCLDLRDNSDKPKLKNCNHGGSGQRWHPEPFGNTGAYKFRATRPGYTEKCLTVFGGKGQTQVNVSNCEDHGDPWFVELMY